MKNRIFTLFIVLLASCSVVFASDTSVDGIWYIFDDNNLTAAVTYRGSSSSSYSNEYQGEVVISSSVTYNDKTYGVTSIGNSAFYNCSKLTSVTIPNSVTSIGNYAFSNCAGLASVTIPNSVTSIGNRTFYDCSKLTSVTIGDNVTSIGSEAFKSCDSLSSVTFGNRVANIGSFAFSDCSKLTSVTIPNNVTSIGSYAFSDCNRLNSIILGEGVTSIGSYAFDDCISLTFVVMQAENPPSLGTDVFNGNNLLESVYVPCGTLNAYQNAANWSSYASKIKYQAYTITTNAVNGSVTLEPSEYTGCSDVTLTTTPDEGYHFLQWSDGNADNPRTFILTQDTTFTAEFTASSGTCGKDNALQWSYDDNTHTLTISGTGALTDNYTFGVEAPTKMTTLIIGDNVTAIGSSAFKNRTNLTSVVIGNGVTSIADEAFALCSGLTSLTIGNSVSYIGDYAFNGCRSLTSVEIPNSVTTIDKSAFRGCSGLTDVTIGNGVELIESMAFANCLRLNSVVIPNSVTTIYGGAFYFVPNIVYSGTATGSPWGAKAVNGYIDGNFVYNNSSKTELLACFVDATGEVSIPNSVTSIGNYAFYKCSNLISVTIPNSVTSIGDRAFEYCSGLTSITIPNSVTSIGEYAFYMCNGATSVTIGESVTSIGQYAFHECTSLTSVEISNSVISIGKYTFFNCTSLSTITNHARTPQTITSSVFSYVNKSTCTLSVPKHSVDLYQSADVWQDFVHIDAILQSFTVQFFDWDNTLLSTDEVEEDDAATPPANPSRVGYTFTGWDTDFSSVTEDLTVTAQYTINRYKVDFVDWDNTLLKTDSVNYGSAAATPPANPSRVGYTFTGWDTDFSNVTEDLTVTAQYAINHYQVDFLDWNGTILKSDNVEYGSAAIPPANPSRDWYTFTGWDKDFSAVTSDLTVTAQYEEGQTLDNTIFFINGTNDSEISAQAIEIDFPTPPTIAGFTFLKWRVLAGDIEDGINIQAVYESNTPTSAPSVYTNPVNPAQKLIRDGSVYILTDDFHTYTITGQKVR